MLAEELHRSCQPLLEECMELAGVTHKHWTLPGVGCKSWLCLEEVHRSLKLAVMELTGVIHMSLKSPGVGCMS